MRQLFELCGEDREIRFSPFVWPVIMALKHKGLDYESVPTRFLEKEGYADSGSKTVPVLKDGDKFIADSFEIAKYLDKTYPENPLFCGPYALGLAGFMQHWILHDVVFKLFPVLALDVHNTLDSESAAYFRETREKRLGGMTLEDAKAQYLPLMDKFKKGLAPLVACLDNQQFLCGDKPSWSDYFLFGVFMWVRTVSKEKPLDGLASTEAWFERMLDLYDGYGRKAKCVYS